MRTKSSAPSTWVREKAAIGMPNQLSAVTPPRASSESVSTAPRAVPFRRRSGPMRHEDHVVDEPGRLRGIVSYVEMLEQLLEED